MKIAALTPVTGPYIIARYHAFAKQNTECDLFLIELGETSTTYPWHTHDGENLSYQRLILSQRSAEEQSSFSLSIHIFQVLDQIRPDIVILCGYAIKGMMAALLWSRLSRTPAILLSETKEDDFYRQPWRESLKRFIISQFSAALVGGLPHRRYLVKLGMSSSAIFTGYDVVGNDDFHPNNISNLLSPLSRPYFLSINRFVPKKNLHYLIQAYSEYHKQSNGNVWDLVLCGDGQLYRQIRQQIRLLGLEEVVHTPGFLQKNELLPYFAHAGCFIHASVQEQWGLVVNEAMAAGLPVLVSNNCGCFEDLVIEGVTGFGFDPTDSNQLIELMTKTSSSAIDRVALGTAALQHIQNYSPTQFATGLKEAIDYALDNR